MRNINHSAVCELSECDCTAGAPIKHCTIQQANLFEELILVIQETVKKRFVHSCHGGLQTGIS